MLSDILKEKANQNAGKKGKTSNKIPQSLLSIKSVSSRLSFLLFTISNFLINIDTREGELGSH
jgi:hypothetical protein